MRADLDIESLKRRLQARRDELSSHTARRREAGETVELDQQRTGRLSRMDALQQQAMAKASQRRVANELHRIDSALRRLDAGEYGYCVRCEEEIGVGRLEADPSTLLCLACAARDDRQR